MNSRIKTELARSFRKTPTPSEHLFWKHIRNRLLCGVKFRRQQVINGYIVDFFCPEFNLAVEIDGGIHDENVEYDRNREEALRSLGIVFFRVTSEAIENDIETVLHKLKNRIAELRPQKSGPHP